MLLLTGCTLTVEVNPLIFFVNTVINKKTKITPASKFDFSSFDAFESSLFYHFCHWTVAVSPTLLMIILGRVVIVLIKHDRKITRAYQLQEKRGFCCFFPGIV